MTLGDFLARNTRQLQDAGITSARLDCLVLLEDVLGKDRSHLLAHPEIPLSIAQVVLLNNYIIQRKRAVPLAYIRGKAAFYGREFAVNQQVLVPRPETEAMIAMILEDYGYQSARPVIADIGTGTGCIGITLKLELPESQVFLYDIDKNALKVADKNAQQLNAIVHCRQSDLLQNVTEHLDAIAANLPYVPAGYAINAAVRFEPEQALFAGNDGLDAYRAFWQQTTSLTHRPEHIYTESLAFQHSAVAKLAQEAGYELTAGRDLIQRFALVRQL